MSATQYIGTAGTAAVLAFGINLCPSTANSFGSEFAVRNISKIATTLPASARKRQAGSSFSTHDFGAAANDQIVQSNVAERQTSPVERIVGEMRRWTALSDDWDGQGASAPLEQSVKEAVAFVRMLAPGIPLPDPMVHANGRAGLFWQDGQMYADLEFLGDGRMAYYIERTGDKHKGVVHFDLLNLPPVFHPLLQG